MRDEKTGNMLEELVTMDRHWGLQRSYQRIDDSAVVPEAPDNPYTSKVTDLRKFNSFRSALE